jgi:hypothetical protein
MIGNITRKISEIQKQECEKEITREEIELIIKKMYKNKAAGIDGIPAEFYQKFDFITEWLHEVFKEIIKRGEMTKTMRTAIVKFFSRKKTDAESKIIDHCLYCVQTIKYWQKY